MAVKKTFVGWAGSIPGVTTVGSEKLTGSGAGSAASEGHVVEIER